MSVLFTIIEDVAEEGKATVEPGKWDQNKSLGFDGGVLFHRGLSLR